MDFLKDYRNRFDSYLNTYQFEVAKSDLLHAFIYIMSLGGKRLRPVSLLMTHSFYSDDTEMAMPAALATEVFHNFTLVHDDIMDRAPLRRGKDTTHIRYGINTAILTGDVMLIYVYKLLRKYSDSQSLALIDTLTEMSIALCEGQQMDMDFELMDDVTISDYICMIEKKTAVLFAACLKMGSITGGANPQEGYHLYEFGKNIGIAFQIQDDILDLYGDQQSVGKNICGDIVQNKKTFLYLKALELCSESEKTLLTQLYKSTPENSEKKISTVMDIFNSTNVQEYARQVKEAYLDLGLSHIEALNISEENKLKLRQLSEYLVVRSS